MRTLLVVLAGVMLAACAPLSPAPRSEATLDSGLPMSPGVRRFDVVNYTLRHDIQTDRKAIAGSAAVSFRALQPMETLELDFDGQFTIDAIRDADGPLTYRREPAKLYIALRETLAAGEGKVVEIAYHGKPREAVRAPWDGGFQWSETPSGKPWIATALQGEGCDLWWPCVDHPQREPDSVDLYFTVDAGLTAVANGVLVDVAEATDGRRTFHWRTQLPTNTYGVALNVAPYVLLEDVYISRNGTKVPVQFWAIEEHADRAQELFDREFVRALEFFERKIGPYPWGQEKLGVAETPHLGMEHQTINAYGNEFRRGDFGYDWLFHHELAHEWFGNVMTHATVSDMWLHEGFAAYLQPEYTAEVIGDAARYAHMYGNYLDIRSCNPLAPREELSTGEMYFDGPDGKGPANDIYNKGSWLLESLRYLMGEEEFWRSVRLLVYGTPEPWKLKPPIEARLRSTDDFMHIASGVSNRDLAWFFEVYARRAPLPVLTTTDSDAGTVLRWETVDDLEFPMPVPVRVNGELRRVEFDGNTALLEDVTPAEIQVDPFMKVLRKLPVVPTCEERRQEEKAAND